MSHAGLPRWTSSANTASEGWGTPAIWRAAVAYLRVADVQRAQGGLGYSAVGRNWRAINNYNNLVHKNMQRTESITSLTPGSNIIPSTPSLREEFIISSSNRSASDCVQYYTRVWCTSSRNWQTSSRTGSSILQWTLKFSTVRTPWEAVQLLSNRW